MAAVSEQDILFLKLGQLFRSSGRESEISGKENREKYSEYNSLSVANFQAYCKEHVTFMEIGQLDKHVKGMETMFRKDQRNPISAILEACHWLDLLRTGVNMQDKLAKSLGSTWSKVCDFRLLYVCIIISTASHAIVTLFATFRTSLSMRNDCFGPQAIVSSVQ